MFQVSEKFKISQNYEKFENVSSLEISENSEISEKIKIAKILRIAKMPKKPAKFKSSKNSWNIGIPKKPQTFDFSQTCEKFENTRLPHIPQLSAFLKRPSNWNKQRFQKKAKLRNFVIFESFENLAPLVGRSIDRSLDLAILIDRSIDRSSDRSKERSIDRSTAPATPTTTATTAMTAMTFATTATSMPQASTRTTFYNGGCDAAVVIITPPDPHKFNVEDCF